MPEHEAKEMPGVEVRCKYISVQISNVQRRSAEMSRWLVFSTKSGVQNDRWDFIGGG